MIYTGQMESHILANSRTKILEALLSLRRPLEEIKRDLSHLPWDCEKELVILELNHVRQVLERYLIGGLSEAFVED